MSLTYTVRPITDWDGFGGLAQPNPFRSTWASTQQLLASELEAVNAKDVVLELNILSGQIRRDGMPRADAKIEGRAVRLCFTHGTEGPMSIPCDAFVQAYYNDPADWPPGFSHLVRGGGLTE